MFGGKKQKTLFDYVEGHNPYFSIDNMDVPKYLEGVATQEHKELEDMMAEYWDLLHPAVCDFINSSASIINKIMAELGESRDSIENARRQLTFEQQNVQDLSDKVREIKGELQSVLVVKRDLETRLEDERAMMESQFKEEKRALELIAESKVSDGNIDSIIEQVKAGAGDNAEVQRLKKKVADLESQIKLEREENEKIQTELSTSFMEKIQRSDEIIKNLKARLKD